MRLFYWITVAGTMLVAWGCGAEARAQNTAVLRGSVADSASGRPLSGVSVRLADRVEATVADELGRFRLTGLPAGTYVVRATGLGLAARQQTVTVAAGQTATVALRLPATSLTLAEVTVAQPRDPNQSLAVISNIDRLLRPVNSAQDLLPLVPGLVIAQHAGGGKAEQIFVRGFDADHGTDFNVSIDGLPVNMVSHAHGQGYADFHFVIPETVDQLRVYKGPYTARFGDFATAGAGEFTTKTRLDQSQVKLEVGQFDTRRAVALVNLLPVRPTGQRQAAAYVAGEYTFANSYFDAKQDFRRFNGLAKYTGQLSDRSSLMVLGSQFASKWDASGQIPERGVDDGTISRFGSIDPTEGGSTSRTNATAVLTTDLPHNAVLRQQVYYTRYDFNLYSNFTFFLNDPVNGDGIRQTDARNLYGYTGTYSRDLQLGSRTLRTVAGLGTRLDDTHIALRNSARRVVLDTIRSGRVYEQNFNGYLEGTLGLTDRLTLNAALRADYFRFAFREDRAAADSVSGRAGKGRVSPKLNLYYDVNPAVQLFVRSGFGFHSNDARAVVTNAAANVLPRAIGYEVGSTFKPVPALVINAALWALHLQDELIYVGDEGVVESAGRTRRLGFDLSARYQLTRLLFADVDLNLSRGRLVDEPEGANRIPLAPSLTSVGGLTLRAPSGLGASLRYRHIDSRAANEDNSVQARGYFLLDAVLSYTKSRFQVGASVENLLNVEWNQAQFDTTTRLRNEAEPVSELHFTPGTPFYAKLNASLFF
ncbi:TonB-dependent receptor [Hymenobacter terrestris]|uniref:TonB-dependent receptor n=1 Tax=Hymenobacter terrestris TaxID=2748310 RepID=A0ABX2PYJ0_9BACT|nr:TonB-dependent receptor [Hymenobacter terrestris]NVO83736.1 TonB-dependent receptor [Hymenobacter terrestris]